MATREVAVSCGVIVTDGATLLLGHATGSPRWDIPKGMALAGEAPALTAVRELREETGLQAPEHALHALGRHAYFRGKDLVLFAWFPASLPDPAALSCTSLIDKPGRVSLPEMDRFGLFTVEASLKLVGRNLARVLGTVWPALSARIPDPICRP